MLRKIAKDEEGFYFVFTALVIALLLLPLISFVYEGARFVIAKSESQITVDAMALSITNASPKHRDSYYISPTCDDDGYEGYESHIDYVGTNKANALADSYFEKNRKFFRVVDSKLSHSIVVVDEYPNRGSGSYSGRIPASLKDDDHFPVVSVKATFSYSPFMPIFFGKAIDVTVESETAKYFRAESERVEITLPSLYCPPPEPPPTTGGGGFIGL